MALYDGFFDAEVNEEGGEYDREYDATQFTDYFAHIVGSGVCVHGNPDSFRVRMEDGKAVVSPGYLFIQGYYCKNDADYTINLPGSSNYAILAHLNLGKRMIELSAESVAQAYPDSLVLAIVSPTSAEDTRYNTDICGVIDTAGELSAKVEWAINYIDNEIEDKLAGVEADINAQSERLDRKIAEVQAVVDRISPPPVGSIKLSASNDVGEEWIPCDGSFVNEQDYPELVASLGKLIPSGDKFKLLSDGEIGPQITNGAVYGGRMWVYSYSAGNLYGVDLDGNGTIKTVPVTSDDANFSSFLPPTVARPLCLSIVPHTAGGGAKLFLSQIILNRDSVGTGEPTGDYSWMKWFLLFGAEFSGSETSIKVSAPFRTIGDIGDISYFNSGRYVPYVVSTASGGSEVYHCGAAYYRYSSGSANQIAEIAWNNGSETATLKELLGSVTDSFLTYQRIAFQKNSVGEMTYANANYRSDIRKGEFQTSSFPSGIFDMTGGTFAGDSIEARKSPCPISVISSDKGLFAFDKNLFPAGSISQKIIKAVKPGLKLPSAARVFVDGGAYLWGKDVFMIFVGTGIIFSRTLDDGDFGYLDTTSVLGTITQFGYLGYSQDEGTLYLLGQDTANEVKVAKIVLNTLYDYANDGAWLPMIAADGVPAYIKAYDQDGGGTGSKVPMTVTVIAPTDNFASYALLLFNGEAIAVTGAFTRYVDPNGTFTVGVRSTRQNSNYSCAKMNGSTVVRLGTSESEKSATFNVADFITSGITLQGAIES